MEELIAVLIGFAILLAVVTLLGHGIWVVLAWLFRQLSSKPKPRKPIETLAACPRCFSTLFDERTHCRVCNWPYALPTVSLRPALLAQLRKQLDRQKDLGTLDESTYRELAEALQAHLATAVAPPAIAVATEEFPEVDIVEAEAVAPPPTEPPIPVEKLIPPEQGVEQPPSAQPLDVGARARRYAAAKEAEAIEDVEVSPALPVPGPARREALSRVLSAFMEEKNIRWGELVGGLLIVGCSIALVISFWAEIAERPLLKFVIFSGVSAALFGAGFYTLHRWQIHTTSRGLLTIATLLVPLNFLAIAAFTRAAPPTDALSIGGEVFSLALFATLCFLAARSIMPSAPLLLTVAVIATSLVQLITRRFAGEDTPLATLYGLASLPVGCLVAIAGIYLLRLWRQRERDETTAGPLFLLLGVASFAAVLPFGLLVYESGAIVDTLSRLAPLITLLGLPALAAGLLFWRGAVKHSGAVEQTIGIGVGVAGAVVMAAALVLAWPDPALLLPTAITTAVLFVVVAFLLQIAPAHLVSCCCLAVAWLVGFHLVRGDIGWMLNTPLELVQATLTAASGNALAPVAVLFALAAVGLGYVRRRDDAQWYLVAAAGTVAVSLLLIAIYGFARAGDPHHVTWTLCFYALITAVATWKSQREPLAWSASLLLLAAIAQGVVFRYAVPWQLAQPWVVALLLHASVVGVAGITARTRGPLPAWIVALFWSSLAATAAAIVMLIVHFPQVDSFALASYLAWIAAVWLAVSLATGWRSVFAAFQLVLFLAIASALTSQIEERSWYVAARYPWLDPWFLQMQGIALASYCSAWTGMRLMIQRLQWKGAPGVLASRLGESSNSLPIDRWLEVAAFLLLIVTAIYGVAPGVAQELAVVPVDARLAPSLESFELWGANHAHAFAWGGWLLLLAVAAMLTVGLWHDLLRTRLIALLLVLGAACLLLAARWEANTAAASALRWSIGGFAIVASIPIWGRTWCRSLATVARLSESSHDAKYVSVSNLVIASEAEQPQTWSANPPDSQSRVEVPSSSAESVSSSNTRTGEAPAATALDSLARSTIIAFVVVCYAAMGLYVAWGAVARAGVPSEVATLLSWLVAACLLAFVIALPIAAQQRAMRAAPPSSTFWPRLAAIAWQTLLMMGIAPLAACCIYIVAEALKQYPVVGPAPGSWFARVSLSVSYGVPLAALIVALLGHAARERSAIYTLSAALLVNLLASMVYLFELTRTGRPLDVAAWIELAQLNAIVAAVYSLAWLAVLQRGRVQRRRAAEPTPSAQPSLLLGSYVAFGAALCGLTIAWGAAYLFVYPDTPGRVAASGNWVGWLALLLSVTTVLWLAGRAELRRTFTTLAAASGVLAAMTALTSVPWDTGNWLAYHVLLAGLIVAAFIAPWIPPLSRRAGTAPIGGVIISTCFASLSVVLALRALGGDPQAPWWTVGGLAAVALLSCGMAWQAARRSFVWAAAALFNLAASIWWIDIGFQVLPAGDAWPEFFYLNVIVLALLTIYAVVIERRCLRAAPPRHGIGLHRLAVWGMIPLLWLIALSGLAADVSGYPFENTAWMASAAFVSLLAAAVARFWDGRTWQRVGTLYLVGGLAVAMLLDGLDITDASLSLWAITMFASAYALASSYLWSRRTEMAGLAARFGMPASTNPQQHAGQGWLTVGNSLIALLVTAAVFWIECTYADWTQRNPAAYSLLGLALAFALLSRGRFRSPLQYTSLVYGVLFAVAWGLSWIEPDAAGPLLNRLIVTVVALAIMIPLYGFGLVKVFPRANEWTRAAQRLVPVLVAIGAAAVMFVVGVEVLHYMTDEHVPVGWPARTAVALALTALALAALAAAVLPGRDPLGLSQRGRTAYVYAAEVVAALAFVHVRVTMPWLFSGFFTRMWPLIAMGIAFLGVGFSEYCRRRRLPVLSQPLETSAALLPLLPLLGFWVVPNEANYALVLLTVGVLYAVLAVLRKSFAFSILAVLAANASLWRLLYTREGLGLAEHPQLWLIPPAVCVLVASYLNRSRLSGEQLTTIRYLSAIVIYAASTADIFLNGVAEAPWLPAVLAALSLLGIFAGILLRVRAFLFLGTTFLVVALLTVIWHAAVEQQRTWIWWASGIVTGVLIIALFGLFEKKRDEMLRLVERLKEWDA